MSMFAVTREAGPGWAEGKGAVEQPGTAEHAAFMSTLADEGLILLGGPLAGSEHGRVRVLLIAQAASENDVLRRLAEDPWAVQQRLVIAGIEPWNVFLGADRLPGPRTTHDAHG